MAWKMPSEGSEATLEAQAGGGCCRLSPPAPAGASWRRSLVSAAVVLWLNTSTAATVAAEAGVAGGGAGTHHLLPWCPSGWKVTSLLNLGTGPGRPPPAGAPPAAGVCRCAVERLPRLRLRRRLRDGETAGEVRALHTPAPIGPVWGSEARRGCAAANAGGGGTGGVAALAGDAAAVGAAAPQSEVW